MWPQLKSKPGDVCGAGESRESGRQEGRDVNSGAGSQQMTLISHRLPQRLCQRHKSRLITFNLRFGCKTEG